MGCFRKIDVGANLDKLIAIRLIAFGGGNLDREIYKSVTIGLIGIGADLDRLVTVGFGGFGGGNLDRLNYSKLIFGLRILVR